LSFEKEPIITRGAAHVPRMQVPPFPLRGTAAPPREAVPRSKNFKIQKSASLISKKILRFYAQKYAKIMLAHTLSHIPLV